jgi:hypothetical protein
VAAASAICIALAMRVPAATTAANIVILKVLMVLTNP